MRMRVTIVLTVALVVFSSCSRHNTHEEMMEILAKVKKDNFRPDNMFVPQAKIDFIDSLLATPQDAGQVVHFKYLKARALMELGKEDDAIRLYEEVAQLANGSKPELARDLAIDVVQKVELKKIKWIINDPLCLPALSIPTQQAKL